MNDNQASGAILFFYGTAIGFFIGALATQTYMLGVIGYIFAGIGMSIDLYRSA